MRPNTTSRWARFAGLVAAFVAVIALVIIAPSGALMLSPALALAVLIALGLFPDEQLIHRLRRRFRKARSVSPPVAEPVVEVGRRERVGRAIAFALSVRPPPAADPSLI